MTTDTLKPEELRIGNWLIHNSEWSHRNDVRPLRKPFPFQWDDSDWYALGESTLMFEQISPIPLTPEILEKCGLNENVNTGWYMIQFTVKKSGRWITRESALSETDDLKEPFLRIDGIADVYFVHQLQNLIYALTQTEIEIQL